jgi:hypothetical protein
MSEFSQPQLTVLFDTGQIQARIRELGAAITRDYAGQAPLLVVVLKGAVPFGADLVRAIDLPITLDFIAVSSYGMATKSSGEVRLLKDLDTSLRGQPVIIVEDIVDTGLTLVLPARHVPPPRSGLGAGGGPARQTRTSPAGSGSILCWVHHPQRVCRWLWTGLRRTVPQPAVRGHSRSSGCNRRLKGRAVLPVIRWPGGCRWR